MKAECIVNNITSSKIQDHLTEGEMRMAQLTLHTCNEPTQNFIMSKERDEKEVFLRLSNSNNHVPSGFRKPQGYLWHNHMA